MSESKPRKKKASTRAGASELNEPRAPRSAPLDDPELYLNRELAWLSFNERVLGEAENKVTPLMERLKFATIYYSNLDEFFMVRLSALLRIWERDRNAGPVSAYPDEPDAEETLDEVSLIVRAQLKRLYVSLNAQILPALAENGIAFATADDLSRTEEERIDDHFEEQIFPVLTPLAVDPAHPFPYLTNLSLYLAVHFEETGEDGEPLLAFVEIPSKLPRMFLVSGRGKRHRFVLLEDIIKRHLTRLFPWTQVRGAHVFRVTRNLDYQLLEGEVKDLMKSIEFELRDRAQKIVVRMEHEASMPDPMRNRLRAALELDVSDVYEVPGRLNLKDMNVLLKLDTDPALRDPPFNPRIQARLADETHIFDVIRERDAIVHHPYDSFVSVLEFLRNAAEDPDVLAIKQTLYRTGGDSPIIESLVQAAQNGKQVTAVVELKARFDEQNNIEWARRLERAGAHVVFGFVGLKTHAKCTLVVRRENGLLQRYVHLSTGNYNSSTAKLYTDLGHFTADEVLTSDVVNLFNLLTGFNIIGGPDSAERGQRIPEFEKIRVAPFQLRQHFIQLIEAEKKIHSAENPGHIILKMNSLVDQKLIQALYKASQKGVRVDLIVRGVCTLRPGIPGISENIRVVSVIDRFLEHSRIFWFKQGNKPVLYLGSADFMPRNLERRVEVAWPVGDEGLKTQIRELLDAYLRDNCKAHVMQPDGSYKQATPGKEKAFRCQENFIEQARREGVKTVPYDKSLRRQADRPGDPRKVDPRKVDSRKGGPR